MVNVYIKERINDQTTICAGGVTSNTTYLGKILTLFMTKICDFPYPIYDLTKNLIPYL